MGIDSVSLSTRTGLGSIYNQWKYAVNNKKTTDNFKTYLLSSQEHLNQLETLFTDYGHVSGACGDTFVKESIIELQDGRLLCLDPDEAKAYILDLNDVNSNSQQYNLTVIQPDNNSASFSEQITNLMSKITTQLGADGISTTKDGTNIDSSLLINTLSGNAKTQYCDEMGISDTSSTDNTYTSGKLKLFAGKGISDITTDQNEHDYYKAAFEAMGITFNSDNNTFNTAFDAGGTSFTTSFNDTINSISKIMEKGSTATDQDKLNLLQIIRKMSTIEYELLEKLNPGFTEALNTLIGDFQSRTYLDRNGNQTGLDTTISYETVMQEKLKAMSNDPSCYLSTEDRTQLDNYLGKYLCKKDGQYITITKEEYLKKKSDSTYSEFTEITSDWLLKQSSDDLKNYNIEIENNILTRLNTAKTCISRASSSTAYKAMSNAISSTVTYGVSDTTIENYKDDIKAASGPDEILMAFLEASNSNDGPEIIAKILEDPDMVTKLKNACAQKGTLSILDKKGTARTGLLYDINGIQDVRTYTVENILNHLEYQTNVYYSNKTDSTSSLNSSRAINGMEDGLYRAENGYNESDEEGGRVRTNVECSTSSTRWATAVGTITGFGGLATSIVGGLNAATDVSFWTAFFGNTTGITAGAVGMAVIGAGIGAATGWAIGNQMVNGSNSRYQNSDGTFNYGKANWVKTMTSLTGAFTGFALSNGVQTGGASLFALIPAALTALAAGLIHYYG